MFRLRILLNTKILKKNNRIVINYKAHSYSTTHKFIDNVDELCLKLKQENSNIGNLIMLNGVSTSGKSTLSKKFANYGFKKFSFDESYFDIWFETARDVMSATKIQKKDISVVDLWKQCLGLRVELNKYNLYQQNLLKQIALHINLHFKESPKLQDEYIYDKIYLSALPILLSGQNVAVDAVFENEAMSHFRSFNQIGNVYHILRYTQFRKNIEWCIERNKKSLKENTIEFRNPIKVFNNFFDLYKIKLADEICAEDLILETLSNSDFIDILKMQDKNVEFFANNFLLGSDESITNYLEESGKLTEYLIQKSLTEEIFVINNTEADFVIDIDLMA